jgi:hypothetical protein
MADNTMIIVAVIAVLVCICSSISGGVAFYMNQATPETAGSPPPPVGSPPPPAGSPPPPAGSPPPPAGSPPPPAAATVNANPGEAISCTGYNPKGDGAIYRYDGDRKMRHYPTADIAGSWDPNWGSGGGRKIDCTGFTLGTDITLNPASSTPAPNLFNGFGSATKLATATPEVNVKVGQAIGCITGNPKSDTGALYRYLGNKKISHYPNEGILNFWGSTGGDGPIKTMDCTGFTLGDDMMVPNSGDSVSCIGNEGYIQRYVGDKTIRGYPSEEIADSWNSNWRSNKVVDCSGLKAGPVMEKPKETPWNNCAVWLETTPGKHDDWCRNDFGSHATHVGQGQHGCPKGQGKGVCKN